MGHDFHWFDRYDTRNGWYIREDQDWNGVDRVVMIASGYRFVVLACGEAVCRLSTGHPPTLIFISGVLIMHQR